MNWQQDTLWLGAPPAANGGETSAKAGAVTMGLIGDALNSAENDVNNVFVDRNGKPTCCCIGCLILVGVGVVVGVVGWLIGGH